MSRTFQKAMMTTLTIGFGVLGVYVGLCLLRVAIEAAGWMLGTTFGTVVLAIVLWRMYEKKFKD